jgi:iron complex outermembrane receptor protein
MAMVPMMAKAQSAAPVLLDPVVVQSATSLTGDPGGETYAATRSRAATKSNTALIDVPQTVNVVTRTEMDAQGSTSVVQALRYTPGVVGQYGDNDVRYDWLTVRGFVPGRYLDGLVLPFGIRGYAQPRIEAYGLERIDVLKGPSSGLYGQSAPGGIVNMTSKRPTAERLNEITVSGGSFDQKQIGFDFSGPVDEEGKFLYRLTGVGRDSDTQYDHVDDKRVFIAPSFTWRLSSDTTLNISAQYQKIKSNGGGGAPVLPYVGTMEASSQGRIPRDRFVGDPDYDYFSNEQKLFGYTLDHVVNDKLSFRQTARYSQVDTNNRRVQLGLMATDTKAVRYAWAFPESADTFQIDNQAHIEFGAGPTLHHVTAGVDYLRERSRYTETQLGLLRTGGATSPYRLFDLYNPDYGGASIAVPPDATVINQRREQLGAYLEDQIDIERFRLTLAGRQDWARTDTNTRNAGSAGKDANVDVNRFTGRAALAYRFDSGFAPYVSYSTSFQPVAGTTRTGDPLKPTTGEQIEAGLKYQTPDQSGFASIAAFQIKQDNVSAPDTQNTSYSVQTGQVRLQGLELEGKATLARGLNVTMSYAYTDSNITKTNPGDTAGQVGNRMAFVPRHQAAAWVDYTLQSGPLAGLGLGAGARYRGSFFGDLNNAYSLKPVTLVDASIRYDLGRMTPALRGADVSLNVQNLFDKKYVVNCLAAIGCYWGTERTTMATMRYRW